MTPCRSVQDSPCDIITTSTKYLSGMKTWLTLALMLYFHFHSLQSHCLALSLLSWVHTEPDNFWLVHSSVCMTEAGLMTAFSCCSHGIGQLLVSAFSSLSDRSRSNDRLFLNGHAGNQHLIIGHWLPALISVFW